MRTNEQISNLRNVLVGLVGPGAYFLSKEAVNQWADNFQEQINQRAYAGIYRWVVRVRTIEDSETPWDDIKPEPMIWTMWYDRLRASCNKLLDRYPSIIEFQFSPQNSQLEPVVLKRM